MRLISKHALDKKYQLELMNNGVVRIPNFLNNSYVNLIESVVKELKFNKAVVINDKAIELTKEYLENYNQDDYKKLSLNISEQASKGVGFVYGRNFIDSNSPDVLKELVGELSSSVFFHFLQSDQNFKLSSVDCQATEYKHGDFLTRHNDVLMSENRVFAYVISLTPFWHSDWGGLLHFLDKTGEVTNTYVPKYNCITIFDVNKIHSVSYVTPFAKFGRYSLTGWFKAR